MNRDDERRRLMQKLHGGVHQRLSAIARELDAYQHRMPQDSRIVLEQASMELRGISRNMERLLQDL